MEPADGVRTDRGHLQPAGRRRLVLDGPTLAKIFNGAVTTWNEPEIAALNPGKTLPGDKINVVFRSDESGTTDNFQKYLDAASDGAWGKGAGKTFNGGVGEGAKGNEGTSAAIKSTAGSITYNEWSFATKQDLQIARVVTSAGPDPVEADGRDRGQVDRRGQDQGRGQRPRARHLLVLQADRGGCVPDRAGRPTRSSARSTRDAEVAPAVKAFLTVATTDGQKGLEDDGYIPIPDTFKAKLTDSHQRHLLVLLVKGAMTLKPEPAADGLVHNGDEPTADRGYS